MGPAALWTPLALLFLAAAVPTQAQTAGAAGVAERHVAVTAGAPLRVECALRVEAAAAWRHEGGAPAADLRPSERAAADGGGGVVARLEAPVAAPHHAGLYTCGPQPQQRVRVTVLPPPGEAQAGGAVTYWDVGRALELECNLTNPDKMPVVWTKNETDVSELSDVSARVRLEQGGAKLVLPPKTHEDDFGNYTCAVGGVTMAWRVQGRAHAKIPPNTNVVEGQKLKLTCRLIGKPYPPVAWLFSNSSGDNASWVPAMDALGGERAALAVSEQGVTDGELTVAAAQLTDAGSFACVPLVAGQPQTADSAAAAHTVVRVKDMYAALWPFLGICAEVFVLCAIILVYEKRRTKPELDDSDTDNHDQKKS